MTIIFETDGIHIEYHETPISTPIVVGAGGVLDAEFDLDRAGIFLGGIGYLLRDSGNQASAPVLTDKNPNSQIEFGSFLNGVSVLSTNNAGGNSNMRAACLLIISDTKSR